MNAADRLGAGWLARIGRALLFVYSGASTPEDLEAIRAACAVDGDPWGDAFVSLVESWAGDLPELRFAAADRAVASFRRLGAGVLESWARGLAALALATAGEPEAREAAVGAETFARSAGTSGPRLFAYLALAEVDAERSGDYVALAEAVGRETGLAAPPAPADSAAIPIYTNGAAHGVADAGLAPTVEKPRPAGPAVTIRCFGGFSVAIEGRPVDMSAVKPRSRALLRLLAAHAGAPVHREVILEALWPEGDRDVAGKSLHVAISTIRGALESRTVRAGASLVVRDGDAYRLDLPAGSELDVAMFDALLAEARAARAGGDAGGALQALRKALDRYTGELLPEDGPAEWVVERRERYRMLAVEASTSLAELCLLTGDSVAAAAASSAGLAIDRYHDPLWRLLIEARDQAGDAGAASRARHEYESVLAGLGVGA